MTKPKKRAGPTKTADGDPVRLPQQWELVVSCAYLRLIGTSQKETAKTVGVGERNLHRWEHCSWWKEALVEASNKWLKKADAQSRRVLLKAMEDGDDATTARWWAERRIPELQGRQQLDVRVSHEEWLTKMDSDDR
jgi:hypothetical protein